METVHPELLRPPLSLLQPSLNPQPHTASWVPRQQNVPCQLLSTCISLLSEEKTPRRQVTSVTWEYCDNTPVCETRNTRIWRLRLQQMSRAYCFMYSKKKKQRNKKRSINVPKNLWRDTNFQSKKKNSFPGPCQWDTRTQNVTCWCQVKMKLTTLEKTSADHQEMGLTFSSTKPG